MLNLNEMHVTALRDVLPSGRVRFSLRGKYSVVKNLDLPTYKVLITTQRKRTRKNANGFLSRNNLLVCQNVLIFLSASVIFRQLDCNILCNEKITLTNSTLHIRHQRSEPIDAALFLSAGH